MKKVIMLALIVLGYTAKAQSIDYNTKKCVGIKGYDPVAYFDNVAKKGNDTYITTHDKVTYKFSSQENLNKFKANPTHYLPQYGGYCAYAIGLKSKKVGINPKTFEIRDDKLYLFYNSFKNNTLDAWLNESPNELREKADNNWENIKENK